MTDDTSLTHMARETRVLLTTVGPYATHGEPVVRACVEERTDYVDLTGEPEFVDRIIARYDTSAQKNEVRIVNCCGFDSVPHDLGVLFTVTQLPEGVPLRIEGFVHGEGSFSGGTWHSAVNAMGDYRRFVRERSARRPIEGERRVGTTETTVHHVPEIHAWACPLPTIDPEVVLRTARVLDRYGPDFRYGHFIRVRSLATLVGGAVMVGGIFTLAQFRATRALLLRMRKPGEGPSPEQRARGRFSVIFLGEGGGRRVVTEVSGGDPGYGETSKMIAESALALALDRDRLPARYGVLTPAVAIGDVLLERLQRAGIAFEVRRTSPTGGGMAERA